MEMMIQTKMRQRTMSKVQTWDRGTEGRTVIGGRLGATGPPGGGGMSMASLNGVVNGAYGNKGGGGAEKGRSDGWSLGGASSARTAGSVWDDKDG